MDLPYYLKLVIQSKIIFLDLGSIPEVGSSKIIILASVTKDIAIDNFRLLASPRYFTY